MNVRLRRGTVPTMRRFASFPLVALLLSCTIVVDGGPEQTSLLSSGQGEGEGETTVPMLGEQVCATPDPEGPDGLYLDVDCPLVVCEAGEFGDYVGDASGQACCQNEWAGSDCVAVYTETCDGRPWECPNGDHYLQPCPDGFEAVCDW